MKKHYNVVLLGCGHIGEEHLKDIYYRDEITVYAVVDMNENQAKLFARKYGALHWGTEFGPFIQDPNVDIVIIATYTNSHLPILKECIKYNKHVLCEKPMSLSLEEAREFAEAADKAPVSKVHVGHILRFNDTYIKARQMIQDGLLGSPLVIRMAQNHHTMNWPRYKRLLQDCPPILDCGVHYFDIMQWFTGAKVERVLGIKQRIEKDLDEDRYNYGLVNVMLSDGSIGYYEAGWSNSCSSDNFKEFIGPKGRIRIVYAHARPNHQEEGDLIEYYDTEKKVYHTINIQAEYKPMWEQLHSLIEAIENDIPNQKHIYDAFSATRVAMYADRALREGKIYDIPPLDLEK